VVFTSEGAAVRESWSGTLSGEGALLLLSLIVLVLAARAWRLRSDPVKVEVWRWLLLGVALIGVSGLASVGLEVTAVGTPDNVGDLVFTSGCFLACAPFFHALAAWNRAQTLISAPDDWLNGLSAFLVLAAIVSLVVQAADGSTDALLPERVQLDVGLFSAVFIALGTSVTVMIMGGVLREARIWLMMVAIGVALVTQLGVLVRPDLVRPVHQVVWLLAAATIAGCAAMAARDAEPLPVTNEVTIVGSLVVLLFGLGVLTVNTGLFVQVDHAVTALAASGAFGAGVRVVRLVNDLTQLTTTQYEARTDPLTGIANRRALLHAIEAALDSGPTTLMIIDLDQFKMINDRYGHATGDRVLRHTVDAFAPVLPANALLARLGGDEFAVLITGAPGLDPAEIGRRMTAALVPMSGVQGRSVPVNASIGVATMAAGADGHELLHRADAAMYQAKTSDEDVCVYDSHLDTLAQERQALLDDLQLALNDSSGLHEQIVVHYQPQLEIATGRVVGAEALVRWQHPRLGLLAPDRFLDLVEEHNLMNQLTARVLSQAAEQARQWQAAGQPLRVSVNLSASSLGHPDTLAAVEHVLRWGMPPERLVLEITETSFMVDPAQALVAMRQFTERGVGVSIDDYGTGYSSLSYLNDLPATELKIDRTFVARMVHDPKTAAIVAGTVALAHQLGLRLVAEGVEDQASLQMLADMGCDESQGYLHSRPLDSEKFMLWLISATGNALVPAPRSSTWAAAEPAVTPDSP
jgi:diguanylate cyclase (GGDEF)-like protein